MSTLFEMIKKEIDGLPSQLDPNKEEVISKGELLKAMAVCVADFNISKLKECTCTFAQKMQGDGCQVCNPTEFIGKLTDDLKEAQQAQEKLVAAIIFALEADEGLEWLRYWNEGSFEVCKRNWPEASEELYKGC